MSLGPGMRSPLRSTRYPLRIVSIDAFEAILRRMLGPRNAGSTLPIFDPERWLPSADESLRTTERTAPDRFPSTAADSTDSEATTDTQAATASLTAAFLVALCGRDIRPSGGRSRTWTHHRPMDRPAWQTSTVARWYR